jgi:hypothetical protein
VAAQRADWTGTRALLAALAALGWLLTGCASLSTGPERPQAASARHLLVAPLNLALRLPEDLEPTVDSVWAILLERGLARAEKVSILDPSDAWELWRGVLLEAQLRDAPELLAVLREFARDLGGQVEFDLLLVPSLVYREARFDGTIARWDGVRRRLSQTEDRDRPDTTEWAFTGEITGVSLHLLAFDPKGAQLAQGWGGLDLVHELHLEGNRHTLELRARPFENRDHLREGVDRALDSCLTR